MEEYGDLGLGELSEELEDLAGQMEAEAEGEVLHGLRVRLRFRNGSEALVYASSLASMLSGFIIPFPAVANERVYSALQAYIITREHFTYPATGLPAPGREEALHNVIVQVGDDDESVETLGHLAKAGISLGALDLMSICVARLHDLPVTPQIEFVLYQINQAANPMP